MMKRSLKYMFPGNSIRKSTGALLIVLFGICLTAAAWMNVIRRSASERMDEIQRINNENSALARAFEEHVRRVLSTADNALLYLQEEYEKNHRVTENMVNFVRQANRDPFLNQIAVADSRGDLVLSAVPHARPINIAQNETFQAQLKDPHLGLYIAKPIITKVSGTWSFFLCRRLKKPDGSFDGIVSAGLDPKYFSDFFSVPEMGEDRGIVLVGSDGIVRARRFKQHIEIGQDLTKSKLFSELQRSAAGSFEAISLIDGLPRFISYRVMSDYPLIVIVNNLQTKSLASFEKRRVSYYSSALLFTLFVAGFCFLMIRAQNRTHRQKELLSEELAQRRRAEEELKKLYNSLQAVIDSIDAIVYVTDMNTYELLLINKYARSVFGDVTGKLCWQALQKGQEGPCSFCSNSRLIGTDGEIRETYVWGFQNTIDHRWYECRDKAIMWIDGRTVKLEVALDITERKRVQETVIENERMFRMLTETAFDGFAITEQGAFTEVSEKFSEIFGYGPGELVGMNVSQVVAPEYWEDARQKILSGYDKPYESICIKKNGERFPVEACGKSYSYQGRTLRVTAIRNMADRKRAEEELVKVQKLESIGILAGGIAHDFNNILQAIVGYISFAKMSLGSETEEKISYYLGEAEEAVKAAKDLSFRLLTFSKGGEPVKKVSSAEDVLRRAVSLSLSGSRIVSDLVLARDLSPVEIDEGQMTQVFSNILINAKEAMPEGGTISIYGENVTVAAGDSAPLKEGDYVKISIRDSGTGIPVEIRPKIFDPYFSTKGLGPRKGSGLGLSICLSIVKKHGGHIGVESTVGKGTTFHIYVPAAKEVLSAQEAMIIQEGVPRMRLLFMDDDEKVRGIVGNMMEHLGHQVVYANNGEEAVALYRRAMESGKTFDAVILDLTVQGGMGGDTAVKKLRETDPAVRAVISSGYVDDPVIRDYRAYGFADVITKPYTLDQLRELLAKLQRNQ